MNDNLYNLKDWYIILVPLGISVVYHFTNEVILGNRPHEKLNKDYDSIPEDPQQSNTVLKYLENRTKNKSL